MNYLIESVIEQIPLLIGYTIVEKVEKGYSPDDKYLVMKGEGMYFLRISDFKNYEKRKAEFNLLKELELRNVQVQKPIVFHKMKKDNICYMLVEYIEGTPASEVFIHCSNNIQHKIGLDAGKELFKIHQINAPTQIPKWEDVQYKKFNYYLSEYKKSEFKIGQDNKIISFIEDNINLIKGRPNTLLHDDFHLGHIMILDKKYRGIIDFNGYDFGDPYHDFYNLSLFSRRISEPFIVGQINGYFLNGPNDYFWTLYSLYAAMNIFSTIVWTMKHDPNSLEDAEERIDFILEDHDYFNYVKPRWYNI